MNGPMHWEDRICPSRVIAVERGLGLFKWAILKRHA